ncbi:MAG: hypothetical protein HC786_31250 [Richelia sp. CSU_2_1]|nr:hypothetical protein [Richelia sp. CSU_2_1]
MVIGNRQQLTIDSEASTINCQLGRLRGHPLRFASPLPQIDCQLSTINCQLSTINCQLSTNNSCNSIAIDLSADKH